MSRAASVGSPVAMVTAANSTTVCTRRMHAPPNAELQVAPEARASTQTGVGDAPSQWRHSPPQRTDEHGPVFIALRAANDDRALRRLGPQRRDFLALQQCRRRKLRQVDRVRGRGRHPSRRATLRSIRKHLHRRRHVGQRVGNLDLQRTLPPPVCRCNDGTTPTGSAAVGRGKSRTEASAILADSMHN